MTELKPCPFCGGEAAIVGNRIQVKHTNILFPAKCPLLAHVLYEFQVTTWNTRHDSELIDTQAALKECGEVASNILETYCSERCGAKDHTPKCSAMSKSLSNPLVKKAMEK